ncbi:MAG TPA: DUF177 domain-containing protein [Bacteroidota bacterium]|jgi:uncharacterized protein|nr:DUF177 domain-containing protein [Bacteroidota bacterium]
MKSPKHTDILKIRISGLSNGKHDYHFTADPSEIHLEENFVDPVEVTAVLDKTPGQIYVRANITTAAHFQCDRCLEDFKQNVAASYNMFYVFEEPSAGRYDPAEVQVMSPDATSIDLTEDVRQMVALSVPLKLLCSESCKGLCPSCGANWNERTCDCKQQQGDHRFEGLQNLLKN